MHTMWFWTAMFSDLNIILKTFKNIYFWIKITYKYTAGNVFKGETYERKELNIVLDDRRCKKRKKNINNNQRKISTIDESRFKTPSETANNKNCINNVVNICMIVAQQYHLIMN